MALVLAQLATFQHLLELRNRSRNLLLRILRDNQNEIQEQE
jgi:hypothetical protein